MWRLVAALCVAAAAAAPRDHGAGADSLMAREWRKEFQKVAPAMYERFLAQIRAFTNDIEPEKKFTAFKTYITETLKTLIDRMKTTINKVKRLKGKQDNHRAPKFKSFRNKDSGDWKIQARPLKDLEFENFYEYYG